MGITTDPNDPALAKMLRNEQQESYLVLSDEERAKGFIRPVRRAYKHLLCGSVTTMGQAIAETYARDPSFYGGTMCVSCGTHFSLTLPDGTPAFVWEPDGGGVGA